MSILIADGGSTKCDWSLGYQGTEKRMLTQGISPYFLTESQIVELLTRELIPQIEGNTISKVFYYGTGCKSAVNRQIMKKAISAVFADADVLVDHDLMGAAHALCGHSKGIACILGTGSNSGYYDGKKIVKNSPGIGYVLGDEGSGAYLGKKVLQYFLYKTFDEDLLFRFNEKYKTTDDAVLDHVYKMPLPNRYLASFAAFLAENRGHYMIENIIEDGLNDFFFQHLYKYSESWKLPIHFVGGIAFGFQDVLKDLCDHYELELGNILRTPLDGLVKYHIE
ncbi:MAG: N-acetylglucosamine kinase [Williamsia sp.]|nr:N-acetylglucosamine kinase [Williamsia sp.]